MSEILFRAKRIDNGEWVTGDLIQTAFIKNETQENIPYILDASKADYDCFEDLSEENGIFEVDPQTVCQYINVTDKNDKKIFEGDIVRRKIFNDYIIGEVVRRDIGFCGFMLKCGNSYYHIGKSEHTGISDGDEVIGNIFDDKLIKFECMEDI